MEKPVFSGLQGSLRPILPLYYPASRFFVSRFYLILTLTLCRLQNESWACRGHSGRWWPHRCTKGTEAIRGDYPICSFIRLSVCWQVSVPQETHPIHVSNKVAENFTKLKNDVQDFSMDFTKYVEEQKQKLSEDAKKYEDEIKQLQTQITECVPLTFTIWESFWAFISQN